MLTWLQRNTFEFPPLAKAMRDPNGLLAAGGDLSADRLIQAYRHGCFPWFSEGQPILWWSPDPRTVLFPDELHISRSLGKLLRKQRYEVTFDRDFAAVIQACAAPRDYAEGTWITDAMQTAYLELHRRGFAHSVEVWDQGALVGGLYGLAMGQLFFWRVHVQPGRQCVEIRLREAGPTPQGRRFRADRLPDAHRASAQPGRPLDSTS